MLSMLSTMGQVTATETAKRSSNHRKQFNKGHSLVLMTPQCTHEADPMDNASVTKSLKQRMHLSF